LNEGRDSGGRLGRAYNFNEAKSGEKKIEPLKKVTVHRDYTTKREAKKIETRGRPEGKGDKRLRHVYAVGPRQKELRLYGRRGS